MNAPKSRLVYGIAGCYGNVATGKARQSAEVDAVLFESEPPLELELSELLDELSLLELDSELELALDSEFELALVPASPAFTPESFLSLKSVSYHPLPFSRKLGADSIFFKADSSHCGQSFRGSSENF